MLSTVSNKRKITENRRDLENDEQLKKRTRVDPAAASSALTKEADFFSEDELMNDNERPPVMQLNAPQRLKLNKKRRDKWRRTAI